MRTEDKHRSYNRNNKHNHLLQISLANNLKVSNNIYSKCQLVVSQCKHSITWYINITINKAIREVNK